LVEALTATFGGEKYLEVVRVVMYIKEQATLVALVKTNTSDIVGSEFPIVDLGAVVLQTFNTKICYLETTPTILRTYMAPLDFSTVTFEILIFLLK
jgi:hypothetical protein